MSYRQLPPQYAVHFTELAKIPTTAHETASDSLPSRPQKRTATTLAGAKSIRRALVRRGSQVEGIYALLGVRLKTLPHEARPCGQLQWEWDAEVRLPE
jgi:hypothetical protein